MTVSQTFSIRVDPKDSILFVRGPVGNDEDTVQDVMSKVNRNDLTEGDV